MINESVQAAIGQEGWDQRPSSILEASLNRVLKHISGDDPKRLRVGAELGDDEPGIQDPNRLAVKETPHFAILTSWRKDVTPKENKRNWHGLSRAVRSKDLGFIRLTGSWLETGDDPNTDPFERSVFIPGDHGDLDLKFAKKLGKRFDQDSIIYAGPETKGKVQLWGQNRKTGEWELWDSWKHLKLSSASAITKSLEDQKRKLLRGEQQWSKAGSTQAGGRGGGKIDPSGKDSKLDPGASKTGFLFGEGENNRAKRVCRKLGIEAAPIGVVWYDGVFEGIKTIHNHINEDFGYDGPRPGNTGCLVG